MAASLGLKVGLGRCNFTLFDGNTTQTTQTGHPDVRRRVADARRRLLPAPRMRCVQGRLCLCFSLSLPLLPSCSRLRGAVLGGGEGAWATAQLLAG